MNDEVHLHQEVRTLKKALQLANDCMKEAEKESFKILTSKQIDDVDIYHCVYTINQKMHEGLAPIRLYDINK
tara:strand:- start:189 stop:404 length:216 start_codon:yes stop_codon:yes gene_type:complete